MSFTEAELNQVCQQLSERGEYETILKLSKLSQQSHAICHPYLKPAIMQNPFPARRQLEKVIFDVNLPVFIQTQYATLHKILLLGERFNLKILQSLTSTQSEKDEYNTGVSEIRDLCQDIITDQIARAHKSIEKLKTNYHFAPVIIERYHQLIPSDHIPQQLGGRSKHKIGSYLIQNGHF